MVRQSLRRGSIVTWQHRGGWATGKIIKIIQKGKLKVPNSSVSLQAGRDQPVALIKLIKNNEITNTFVGHRVSSLRRKVK